MELLTEYWPVIVALCGAISAIVIFGGKLADLILKWNQVFQLRDKKSDLVESAHQGNDESETIQFLSSNNFSAESTSINSGNIKLYSLKKKGEAINYRELLALWESDKEFVEFYLSIFKQCGFDSYVWETPAVSTALLDRSFEFVLINNPKARSSPDRDTYKQYFDNSRANSGVVAFPNLGHDAMLIIPSPINEGVNYAGLAEFYSDSPVHQQHALWNVLAREIRLKLSDKPMWVSVAGGGITWLHVRIDTTPKYYRYLPYAKQP